jgi:RimJ/RimL family protein N-acetyltransferase
MPNTTVRLAGPGDESQLEAFLAQHADSSLFLRSFLARGGIVDEGKPLQGTYAVALTDGNIVGTAMHSWHGVLFLQAPERIAEIAGLAVETTKRPLIGFVGPWSQAESAHAALGNRAVRKWSREDLFALSLSDLVAPATSAFGDARCRRATSQDLDLLREWRFEYEVECTGLPETATTRSFATQSIEGAVERREAFLLEAEGTPVSLCTHNARVSETVQIGGVWTPPLLRNRGYARGVVAGALQEAQREGATRAVLFTGNAAARRSYEALGFQRISDYGEIVLAT